MELDGEAEVLSLVGYLKSSVTSLQESKEALDLRRANGFRDLIAARSLSPTPRDGIEDGHEPFS